MKLIDFAWQYYRQRNKVLDSREVILIHNISKGKIILFSGVRYGKRLFQSMLNEYIVYLKYNKKDLTY